MCHYHSPTLVVHSCTHSVCLHIVALHSTCIQCESLHNRNTLPHQPGNPISRRYHSLHSSIDYDVRATRSGVFAVKQHDERARVAEFIRSFCMFRDRLALRCGDCPLFLSCTEVQFSHDYTFYFAVFAILFAVPLATARTIT